MRVKEQKGISFWQWFKRAGIHKSTGYYHVKKYLDELQQRGIVEVRYAPKSKHIVILDEEKLEEFFQEKGFYLPAKM